MIENAAPSCSALALGTKGTSYAQGLSLITDELGLSESEQEAVLSTTALALWFPDEG